MSTPGKWMASTSEETWSDCQEFDTRAEALAYAVSELAVNDDLEDGQRVYTGVVRAIDLDELAASGIDSWSVLDQMSCWLHDNVGDELDYEISASKEAEDDLQERLTATVRAWMAAHNVKPNCFHLDCVESVVWKREGESK